MKAIQQIPVAILARVSTAKQDNDRQVHELTEHAERSGWRVVEVIREQVSGASKTRPDVVRAKELAKAGTIRKVLVHEISRLGRRPALVHEVVESLHESGASLYWHSQRIETLLPDGRRNPAAGIMLAVMAEMAQAERETLIERTRSGLAEARRKGRVLGRPKGSTLDAAELVARHPDIARHLRAGHSIRHAAAITGKSTGTVQAVKRAMEKQS
jgi:DNA invertase Pin-like site-specific DNA recombinase